MDSRQWNERAKIELKTFFQSDAALTFTAEMLSYMRVLHQLMRGKATMEELKMDVSRMLIGMSGVVYDSQFVTIAAQRVFPAFQSALMGYLDSMRYAEEIEKRKGTPGFTPEENFKLMQNVTATSRLHREFAVACVGAERGVGAMAMWGVPLRDKIDMLFELE